MNLRLKLRTKREKYYARFFLFRPIVYNCTHYFFWIDLIMRILFTLIPIFVLMCASSSFAIEESPNLKIGGSGSMLTFANQVIKPLVKEQKILQPELMAIGTGIALKQFCTTNNEAIDIVLATRRIRPIDIQICNRRGVHDVLEFLVGYGALVVFQHISKEEMSLTSKELYLALAKYHLDVNGGKIDNPYQTWNQVSSSLPNTPIKIFGPYTDSGSYDMLISLVMQEGCRAFPEIEKLKQTKPAEYKSLCSQIREDGVFSQETKDFKETLKRLESDKDIISILNYGLLLESKDFLKPVAINSIRPSSQTVQSDTYAYSLPLYIYIKKDYLLQNKEISIFMESFMRPEMIGQDGITTKRGLIPLIETDLNKSIQLLNTQETIF